MSKEIKEVKETKDGLADRRFWSSLGRLWAYLLRLGFGPLLGLLCRGVLVLLAIWHRRSLPRI